MKLNEILSIAKQTECKSMSHGESALIAIQDGQGFIVANKNVISNTGYDHLVRVTIQGNKGFYEILE